VLGYVLVTLRWRTVAPGSMRGRGHGGRGMRVVDDVTLDQASVNDVSRALS